jgi:valyl-tRNA synthetase
VITILEDNLKVLHPFVPFISEEIWQQITDRTPEEALIIASWPEPQVVNESLIAEFGIAADVVSGIRTIRKEKNIAFKETIELSVLNSEDNSTTFDTVISKVGNLSTFNYVDAKVEGALSFRVKSNEYFIPISGAINVEEEIKKLTDELSYTEGFLKSVQKKLQNERFVNNAPDQVIANEKKKQADAEAKITTIKSSLKSLHN